MYVGKLLKFGVKFIFVFINKFIVQIYLQDINNPSLAEIGYSCEEELKQTIYDLLRTIRDPEKPSTLEVKKLK
jgi:hypothetical protein